MMQIVTTNSDRSFGGGMSSGMGGGLNKGNMQMPTDMEFPSDMEFLSDMQIPSNDKMSN